jgi:hypothetical protein
MRGPDGGVGVNVGGAVANGVGIGVRAGRGRGVGAGVRRTGSGVAGARVAGGALAGASVAGVSVAGRSVAGISVAGVSVAGVTVAGAMRGTLRAAGCGIAGRCVASAACGAALVACALGGLVNGIASGVGLASATVFAPEPRVKSERPAPTAKPRTMTPIRIGISGSEPAGCAAPGRRRRGGVSDIAALVRRVVPATPRAAKVAFRVEMDGTSDGESDARDSR